MPLPNWVRGPSSACTACWNAWAESNEAHGCDTLVTGATFELRGMVVADLGGVAALDPINADQGNAALALETIGLRVVYSGVLATVRR